MDRTITGNHHITLSVGDGQEDWDFHTQTLGMRPIKKTMLYDGEAPVWHLLDKSVSAFPERPCIDFLGRAYSYRELGTLVDRAASAPCPCAGRWETSAASDRAGTPPSGRR